MYRHQPLPVRLIGFELVQIQSGSRRTALEQRMSLAVNDFLRRTLRLRVQAVDLEVDLLVALSEQGNIDLSAAGSLERSAPNDVVQLRRRQLTRSRHGPFERRSGHLEIRCGRENFRATALPLMFDQEGFFAAGATAVCVLAENRAVQMK